MESVPEYPARGAAAILICEIIGWEYYADIMSVLKKFNVEWRNEWR